ncbi:hypothetical protein [Micromonospora sp. LOL_023]|uniref:hypothetical protein n=1 Tax=Micromonospora sp. LOL_023 TaxID=3345418 RepID=UPI003A855079
MIEDLMERLARAGVTAIIKIDHERYAEQGEPWTLVISGPALGDGGFVRAEEATFAECVRVGLSRLRDRDERWHWVSDFLPE